MLAGSKSRMNDFVNVEGKDDAVDENTKINRKLKEQADLQKKKQKQQIDAGPSRVMVNAFEAKFTDAGLASTKAGLGKLIARAVSSTRCTISLTFALRISRTRFSFSCFK